MTEQLIAVFIGGGLGSMARFGVSLGINKVGETLFPAATLLSNLLSCLVLSLLVGAFSDSMTKHPVFYLFMGVGFCGGFSTFSTFSLETFSLLKNGHVGMAIANVLISVTAGLFIFWFLSKKMP